MKKKVVYICSPFRPTGGNPAMEQYQNVELAKRACKRAVKQGHAVLCPHLVYPQFLADGIPQEREQGIMAGLRELELADEVWVVGSRISEGMSREISRAGAMGIPIKCIGDPRVAEDRLLEAVLGVRR